MCRPGPVIFKCLKYQYLSQKPQMPPSSIKDHILEARERLNEMCTGEKKSHSFRISKTGLLCQLLYDGNKMEVIVSWEMLSQIRKWSQQKKKCISEGFLFSKTQWHFQRKTECRRGFPEASGYPEYAPQACLLYCPTTWGDKCPWTKEQRGQARPWDCLTPPTLWILSVSLLR